MINPAKRSSAAMAADRADVASMRAALGLLWPIYAVLIILSVGTFALSEGGPFLLQANGMTRATIQGVILSVGQLPAILTASAYGFMRRYVDDRMILTASAVLMGLGLMVIVPIRDPAILTVALVIFGLGSGLKAPAVSSALLAGAPGNVRAAAAGLIFSAIFLGQFLTPLLIEGLDRIVAIHGTFVVFGVALLLVAVFVYFGGIGKALPKQ